MALVQPKPVKKDIDAWISFLSTADIPVLKSTAREIEELKKNNSHILDRSKIKKMHKQKAIEIVKRLFPDKSSEMCKTCDGLAESCLIALYGWFKITGEKHKIMNN